MPQDFDMTIKAFNDMVFFHSFFMAFFPIPFLINIYTLFTYKTYQKVIVKIWFVMPIIFLLVAVGSFSGLFILASMQWAMSWQVVAMIVYVVFVFAGEILRLKRLKLAKTSENLMHSYIRFCKILYICDLVGAILFTFRII
ncbi:TerC family integral membrane protein [Helicobacter fennelliae]|uniref:TerC family integral membrane protein n=1 Tax=Helicobacter fennelliae TaxID=215 RepID=A0A2X3BCJ7_9HELI|nr:hypothetical protein [Helicobacter fennelliae]SQB99487.1 TerC family integral membrane protein [Helicobacter fennelliae]